VEGEAFLAALMEAFCDEPTVGFCWDSGHELCYNRGKDMLALYGNRLIATHINDNAGVSDFAGRICWKDDLHLMPFDGVNDWRRAADRLRATGYDGILTFELNKQSIPGRHESDSYNAMPLEVYLARAYVHACRLAYMIKF
jgi:sugar phosphate isomerase/epimerase